MQLNLFCPLGRDLAFTTPLVFTELPDCIAIAFVMKSNY
jgi:hypothetical protein